MVTNPDMLHTAILPHHTKWFQLFEQLRYIVIDEAHTYRGIFGSHVANVLRRLLRICAHYGSAPRIVCCSATIGNPGELAETLTGRPLHGHRPQRRASGRAPRRHPRPAAHRRRARVCGPGPTGSHTGAALAFLRAGRQTIVFGACACGRRAAADLAARGVARGRGPIDRIRGYRSGYLPSERRAIEAGLRTGEVLGVVSTNALELGIDIGRLDAAVLAGYPGTIAATWQQIGRAGRRGEPSVAILVAGAGALDRFVATHPEYLFEATPEEARLDPENVHVLLAHLRAAAFELPFDPGESLRRRRRDDLLAFLAEEGHVRQADDERWYWASENFPASEINLRVARAGERASSSTPGPERPRVLGEVDLFAARVLVHENAIYLHDSRQYHVDLLDWEERKALRPPGRRRLLHAGGAGGHAQAARGLRQRGPRRRSDRHHGEVMVSTHRHASTRSSSSTRTRTSAGDTSTCPRWSCTRRPGGWPSTPASLRGWRRDELDAALVGAGRALQTVASVLLMSDPHDLGMVAQVRSPHAERPVIYLWEAVPGGVGLSPRLFDRAPTSSSTAPSSSSLAATARWAARPASDRAVRVGSTAARWPRRLLRVLASRPPAVTSAGRAGRVTTELAQAGSEPARTWRTRRSSAGPSIALDRLRAVRAGPSRGARSARAAVAGRETAPGTPARSTDRAARLADGRRRRRRWTRRAAHRRRREPGRPPGRPRWTAGAAGPVDPARPLILLDTETTGLGTGTGTLPFLVGSAPGEGARFRDAPAAARRTIPTSPRSSHSSRAHLPADALSGDLQRADVRLAPARVALPARRSRRARRMPAHLDLLPLARQIWRTASPTRGWPVSKPRSPASGGAHDLPGALHPRAAISTTCARGAAASCA